MRAARAPDLRTGPTAGGRRRTPLAFGPPRRSREHPGVGGFAIRSLRAARTCLGTLAPGPGGAPRQRGGDRATGASGALLRRRRAPCLVNGCGGPLPSPDPEGEGEFHAAGECRL